MRSIGFVAFAVFYFNWEIQAGMFRDYQFNLQLIDSEAARVSTSNDDQALQLTDDPEDREEEGEQSFHIHRKLYIWLVFSWTVEKDGLVEMGRGGSSSMEKEVELSPLVDLSKGVEAGPGEKAVQVLLIGATTQKAKYNYKVRAIVCILNRM